MAHCCSHHTLSQGNLTPSCPSQVILGTLRTPHAPLTTTGVPTSLLSLKPKVSAVSSRVKGPQLPCHCVCWGLQGTIADSPAGTHRGGKETAPQTPACGYGGYPAPDLREEATGAPGDTAALCSESSLPSTLDQALGLSVSSLRRRFPWTLPSSLDHSSWWPPRPPAGAPEHEDTHPALRWDRCVFRYRLPRDLTS